MVVNLHYIHGFLGLPSDWDIFQKEFIPYRSYFYSIEDFLSHTAHNSNHFNQWAIKFNQHVFSKHNPKNEKNILIGYSLGGRLALHCLQNSSHWDAAIIISANPGLTEESEKQSRILNDQKWSERFLSDSWKNIMDDWNAQGVFSNQKNLLIRKEENYNRPILSNMLLNFSLGKQSDFRAFLKINKKPILWLTGECDTKFSKITQEIADFNESLRCQIMQSVGHRIPWEDSKTFKNLCLNFIKNI